MMLNPRSVRSAIFVAVGFNPRYDSDNTRQAPLGAKYSLMNNMSLLWGGMRRDCCADICSRDLQVTVSKQRMWRFHRDLKVMAMDFKASRLHLHTLQSLKQSLKKRRTQQFARQD